jgi:hypothetical protein
VLATLLRPQPFPYFTLGGDIAAGPIDAIGRCRKSRPQEVVYLDPRLPEYRPERSLRHVAGMIWQRCIAIRPAIEPDFVAARGLAVELEPAGPELPNDFSVPEPCQTAHYAATTIM